MVPRLGCAHAHPHRTVFSCTVTIAVYCHPTASRPSPVTHAVLDGIGLPSGSIGLGVLVHCGRRCQAVLLCLLVNNLTKQCVQIAVGPWCSTMVMNHSCLL